MSDRKPNATRAPAVDYKAARAEAREAVREGAVDAAVALLEEEGPEAVTVRKVAAEVGASTQVIYTLFGGKPGLAGAVFGRGHELLRAALEGVGSSDDPMADLRAGGEAYRRRALESPELYQAMFGRSLGEMEPDENAIAAARGSFGALIELVTRGQETGRMQAGSPLQIAGVVFSSCHGACSLELQGTHPPGFDFDTTYAQVLDTLATGLAA